MHRLVHQLRNWQISAKRIVATILIATLILVIPVLTSAAQADNQNLISATQDFLKTVDNARSVFNDFSQDSQGFLDNSITEAQKLLRDLPNELERLSTTNDAKTRGQIRQDVASHQKSLKEFAQGFNARIAEADRADQQFQKSTDNAYSALLKSFKGTQDDLKSQSHQRVADLNQSFKETSRAISSLADSTNRILNGKASLQQIRWDDQINALSQTFDNVNGALQTLVN